MNNDLQIPKWFVYIYTEYPIMQGSNSMLQVYFTPDGSYSQTHVEMWMLNDRDEMVKTFSNQNI